MIRFTKAVICIGLIATMAHDLFAQKKRYVQVSDQQFTLRNEPYKFIGANLWYGMYLGMKSGPGDRDRLKRELDHLQELGVTNLRIMGSSEGSDPYQIQPTLLSGPGAYDEEVFRGLDFLLNEMRKRKMKAVVVLNNFWMWSGGFPQYIKWTTGTEVPFPNIPDGGTWDPFINYSLSFYENDSARSLFRNHISTILNRRNKFSKRRYRNDPTIMAWQLCNEPRGYHKTEHYRDWIEQTAEHLQTMDQNHMVCLGAEGNTSSAKAGVDLYLDNVTPHIDYATTHLWIQNWGWFDPEDPESFDLALEAAEDYLSKQLVLAEKLQKPVVIEEFGVSRDLGSYDVLSSTQYRDRFYDFLLGFTLDQIETGGSVQGCNFWSWGGEGAPGDEGGFWKEGDPLIGDPPHERQGWYSVYGHDQSTLTIIQSHIESLNNQMDR